MRRAARARPRRTARSPQRRGALSEHGARPQDGERLLAVLVVRAVDDQHAVEMVELMLCDARAVPFEVVSYVVAVLVLAREHERRGALDRHAHALQRQAAL